MRKGDITLIEIRMINNEKLQTFIREKKKGDISYSHKETMLYSVKIFFFYFIAWDDTQISESPPHFLVAYYLSRHILGSCT